MIVVIDHETLKEWCVDGFWAYSSKPICCYFGCCIFIFGKDLWW